MTVHNPRISTVVINWNRAHLLRTTLASYLATISVPYEMVIVDNASTDDSRGVIESVCGGDHPNHRAVFLDHNLGGEAINFGFETAQAPFLHVSENDVEYRPGWDAELLAKFELFPELGQISPFAPHSGVDNGELWEIYPSQPVTRGGITLHLPEMNVTTSCVFRRDLWERGMRWTSLPQEPDSAFKFPDDLAASMFVKEAGYWVAWNDRFVARNWGFRAEEWQSNPRYYIEDYQAKPWLGRAGMRELLRARGYDLLEEGGQDTIVKGHGG
jgi:glycosyltransferase involved in cell wall biosynthesis